MTIRAEDCGEQQLGWLVSNHVLRRAAFESLRNAFQDGHHASLFAGSRVRAITQHDGFAQLELDSGQSIETKLVVAADGRHSTIRGMMGIPADIREFGKSMLVCRMQHEEPHRSTALQWFGDELTLATLPLNRDDKGCRQSSVVVTLAQSQIQDLTALSERAFSEEIAQRFKHRFGAMRLSSERHTYPLESVYARHFFGVRLVTTGDASVGMLPITAHGFNFGLAGVGALRECLHSAREDDQDIGAEAVLKRYDEMQRRTVRPLFLATNLISGLYMRKGNRSEVAREFAIQAASRFPPFRHAIALWLTS
ncbi:hypothetical protein A6456_09105 [Paraburkholderia tropica]|nr:hypothetical protein A6456_09105 [Paraburkholderia tropica]